MVVGVSGCGELRGEVRGAACSPRGGEVARGEVANGEEVASGEVVARAAAEDTAAQ